MAELLGSFCNESICVDHVPLGKYRGIENAVPRGLLRWAFIAQVVTPQGFEP
ncbi:MAG: hypothetical protein ACKO8Z_00570 [Prosthecobacter sp.]